MNLLVPAPEHSLHAEKVFDKRDVMEVHWDLASSAGVVAEQKVREDK